MADAKEKYSLKLMNLKTFVLGKVDNWWKS